MRILILSFFFIPISVFSSDFEKDYFSFSFENDVFYEEDDGYSNGLIFNWGDYNVEALNDSSLPTWVAYLADKTYINNYQDRQYSIQYTVGQFIQTPTNIRAVFELENDAPYVGLLAWKVDLTAYNKKISDRLSLAFGLVGPITGAKYVQENLHAWIEAVEPKGWDNQINNEAVFRIQSTRLWRHTIFSVKTTEVDIITGVNAGGGNLSSDLNAGISVRWGQQLESNFLSSSPFLIQRLNSLGSSPNGWYIFANFSSAYVFNDIFIDGNTFQESNSVDLIHWQAGVAIGAQINFCDWNASYMMFYSSDQYKEQLEKSRWGNITISYNF